MLADPKPPRHGGHRTAQLKHIVNELRKVCHHPFLLQDFEPEQDEASSSPTHSMGMSVPGRASGSAGGAPKAHGSPFGYAANTSAGAAAGTLELQGGGLGAAAGSGSRGGSARASADGSPADTLTALHVYDPAGPSTLPPSPGGPVGVLRASGKMQALDSMLRVLRAKGQRVMVLSQSSKALDLIQTHVQSAFGQQSFCRIDNATPSRIRFETMRGFNAPGSQAFMVLVTQGTLGLGTDLPSIGSVIIYDSDWHPRLDMQALRRAHCISQPGQLVVYR